MKLKVLIVEDDATSAAVLKQYLRDAVEVAEADSGETALELVRKAFESATPFDAVLLDIMMPTMNGLEILGELRALEKSRDIDPADRMRIIMTTALSDTDSYMRAFSEECSGYLVKPIGKERFTAEFKRLGLFK